uniref:Innexin n=1 Tax=Ditylenchus dipsaci TaxID=166011 RepID=A0A915E9N7_9BILA
MPMGFGNTGFGTAGTSGYNNNNNSNANKFANQRKAYENPKPNYSTNNSSSSNKMLDIKNIPFFGQGQEFMGKTLWDWFKRPKTQFSDVIDRLNCSIVPSTLLLFVAIITANLFGYTGGEPMKCLKSHELKDEEQEYALDYCQSKNQYYVAQGEGIPWSNDERSRRQLGYYHWVPITLVLQAMLFILPNWLWNAMNQQSGIDLAILIAEAKRLRSLPLTEDERPQLLDELATRIAEGVVDRIPRRIHGFRFGRTVGCYVSLLYVCIKIMYLVNVAGQFWLMNAFIGQDYHYWGISVLKALITGKNWQDSPIFPRLTLCDVPIRRMGDTPRYTLQCHLRINTYIEKIYLFIWWGFLIVAVLTLFNCLYYFVVLILLPCTRERSVRHLLKQNKFHDRLSSKQGSRTVRRFAKHALRHDGVLLFWFIEGHAGPIVARDLAARLFENFLYQENALEDIEEEESMPEKEKFSNFSQSSSSET